VKRAAALTLLLAALSRIAWAQEGDAAPPPVRQVSPILSWGPVPESFDPPAWRRQQHGRPLPRLWLAPTVARLPAEDLSLAGVSVALGFEAQFSVWPALNRWFYGSSFALELRGHALRAFDGAQPSWLLAGGLAVTMNVTELGAYGQSRVRFPSLFGLLLPEAGVAARSPQPTSFYLRWSAPVAVLVEKHVALELVPSVSLLYQGPHGVETLWLLGIGVSWRAMGQPALLVTGPWSSRRS
jgi:hypothetical protein